MAQNDISEAQRKALIFQRRQLQNERNVEEIVRTNTEKVRSQADTSSINRLFIFLFRPSMNVVVIFILLRKLQQPFRLRNDFFMKLIQYEEL